MKRKIVFLALVLSLITTSVSAATYTEKEDVYNHILMGILEHKGTIKVTKEGEYDESSVLLKKIQGTVEKKTKYTFPYSNIKRYDVYRNTIGKITKYTVKITYFQNKTKQALVDKWATKKAKKLKLDIGTRRSKLKRIVRYVAKYLKYDFSARNDSAYKGIKKRKGTCQSYAMLVYALCKEANIPCYFVKGKTNGTYHEWNIVKIGGKLRYTDACFYDSYSGKGKNPYMLFDKKFCNKERKIIENDITKKVK